MFWDDFNTGGTLSSLVLFPGLCYHSLDPGLNRRREKELSMKKNHRWISLRTKMNVLLVTVILFVSFGLLGICYAVHSRAVDRYFIAEADKAARAAVNDFASDSGLYIRSVVISDEFRAVRAEAEKAGDENILKDWMASHTSYMKEIPSGDYSLYDSYQIIRSRLGDLMFIFVFSCV